MSTKPKGIAARAGRWSAQHRKIAIFGWLAFVIAAFVIGNSTGTKKVEQTLPGESGRAQKIQEDNFPHAKKTAAEETILIQSKTLKADDPQYKAVVKDVERQIGAEAHVRKVQSPYAEGLQGLPGLARPAHREGHVRDPRQAHRDQGAGQARPGRHEEPPEGPPRVQHLPVRRCQHRERAGRRLREGHAEGGDAVAADHAGASCCSPSARSWPPACRCCSASPPSPARWASSASVSQLMPVERLNRQRRPARRSCRRRGLLAVLHPARA